MMNALAYLFEREGEFSGGSPKYDALLSGLPAAKKESQAKEALPEQR